MAKLLLPIFLLFSTPVFAGCGVASHYGRGDGLHGSKTASGGRFSAYGMTAAHRSLPFGTNLNVCNTRNGKCAVVRVTDRGPFVRGRVLDLSYAAAQSIGMGGLGRVCF